MTGMPQLNSTMTYDHSNRMVEVTNSNGGEAYIYAPDNRRVWRSQGVDPTLGNTEHVMLYSPGGQLMGRYRILLNSNANDVARVTAVQESVYWGGRLIYTPGTGRKVTDRLSSVGNESTYYPYGEYRASGSTNGGTDTDQFATYKRDGKTGLDYADQRYYAAGLGRFGSFDPDSKSSNTYSPLSLNRYAYVNSDPLNAIDIDGRVPCGSRTTVIGDRIVVDVYECLPSVIPTPPPGLAPEPLDTGSREHVDVPCSPIPSTNGNSRLGDPALTLRNNVSQAQYKSLELAKWQMYDPQSALGKLVANALWFYDMVKNRGTWDYKQLDSDRPNARTTTSDFENFGNFNFGATGFALGFDLDTLQRMAGWAQRRSGNSTGLGDPGTLIDIVLRRGGIAPYSDDPRDQEMIRDGFNYGRELIMTGCK
jgi:RHS repeat-associated protein